MDWNKLRERVNLSYDEAMIRWPSGWTSQMKDDFFRALNQAVAGPSFGLSFGQSTGLDTAMGRWLGDAWKGGSNALTLLTAAANELFTRPGSSFLVDATDKIHEDCKQQSFRNELAMFVDGSLGMRRSPLFRLDEKQTFYLCCILEMQVYGSRSSIRTRIKE